MRNSKQHLVQLLIDHPVVPVIYHPDMEIVVRLIQCSYDAGIRVFEFTNRGEEALKVFFAAKNHIVKHCPGMSLGIGTILTNDQAAQFIALGADFIVQPVTNLSVGEIALHNNIPWIPGAFTPTEVYQAHAAGADLVKVFPAGHLGASYIKALKAPLPDIPLMVTGGIPPEASEVKKYLDAGASGVGIGAQLFSDTLLHERDYDAITVRLNALTKSISNVLS